MKYLCNYAKAVLFMSCFFFFFAEARVVRVLLRSWKKNDPKQATLKSEKGFSVIDPEHKKHHISLDSNNIVIDALHGKTRINGKSVARDHFFIIPKVGSITFENSQYPGSFLIARHENEILIINCVELEEYVCSVLRTESWPGWPLEVNKVFAIASRSYVIAMIQQADAKNSLYHVRDTNHHQTYAGIHTSQTLRNAVKKTKGCFLSYEGKPAIAMFDSCCGGVIPSYIDDFDFSKAPYLARTYACKHCRRCKIFQWNAEYDFYNLESILRKNVPTLSKIKSICVTKKDKAGLAKEITIEPGCHVITGKKLYSFLKEVKSFNFAIKRNKNKIIFNGKGFGHHIGLCQWGAREMVRDGWHYKRILRFYYPGTKLAYLS